MNSIDLLNPVSAEPIGYDIFSDGGESEIGDPLNYSGNLDDDAGVPIPYGPLASNYAKVQRFKNSVLKPIQKYSSISFSIFAVIHGITVTVGPLVSVDFGNELLSLGRSIYQSPGLEEILVWGSLALHVSAGVLIRCIKKWSDKMRYGGKVRKGKDLRYKRKNSAVDERVVLEKKANSNDHDVKDDYEIGLIGGVTSFLGLGIRRNVTFRKFGISTLQMSGWLSIPLVLYHLLQVRVVPLLVDGDSGYIGFEYISYLFNSVASGKVGAVVNWIVYPSLIVITTYHMVYGLLNWNNVKSLRIRKLAVVLINIIGLLGLINIYRLSKLGSGEVAGFVLKKFDKYLDVFYHLKYFRR
jgi:hypothetical protein